MPCASKNMSNFIPVNEPIIGEREKELVLQCLETGWISSEGPFVAEFEEKFSRRVDRCHGIACSNGSAALDIAVAALKLGPGDEVILPTFTIISCAAAVVRAGATPVVVDCDPLTWNMVPDQVAAAITNRTAAIMVVHIYGLPVDMDPILALAERYQLAIIEDAAEMIGQTYKGRPCGSFGHLSTFSFYPNKHITTGEGGMVVTNDPALAERCRSLRNLCFQSEQRFVHEELGWNYRLTNLQAALGVAQLESLSRTIERKRNAGLKYGSLLKDLDGEIQRPLAQTDYATNIYWVYGIVLCEERQFNAKQMMTAIGEKGIGTRPFFWPLHEQPVFKNMGLFKGIRLGTAERIARQGFYIPSGICVTDSQQELVSRALHSSLEYS
ncbi:perosamine synthetase [Synechococcus sp. WH 5701]|nr:perosamine synthetase [Synechococcus sp. WH 5701]